ncbi:hypothetical protein LTR41_008218 [Exophiala xenobiotica]|nr:hypothetical protein LTR41_008218 [Exophiala xenobiotica]
MAQTGLRVLIVLVLLLGLVCAVQDCPGPEGPKEEGCTVCGNVDFYGLGVRIGIYTQWLSSWIANNFLAEEIIGTLETNSIFLLALFSTVFYYSITKMEIRAVDVLVIHQLCLGFIFSIMSLWGYRTMYYKTEGPGGRRHFGGFGTHFRLILMSMITAYGVWFWIEGVEDGLPSTDRRTACGGLKTFFFTPMKVESWSTRSVQLVIAIGAAVYYGIMGLAAIAALLAYCIRKISRKPVHWELVVSQQDSDIALTKREFSYWYVGLSCFNLFWIIFAMVSIEVTLNLNHMNNVIGPSGLIGAGQLIPLAIGSISLVRVLYMIVREKVLEPEKRKSEKNPGSGNTESPATSHTYTEGLGFGFSVTNTPGQGVYSLSSPGRHFVVSPGIPPPSTGFAESDSNSNSSPLPFPPPATATATATSAHHKKRSLPHRILLAWLPWLGIFEWSRHSLSPSMGSYSKLGPGPVGHGHHKKDSGVSFSFGPTSSRSTWRGQSSGNTVTESPSTALLGSPPPPQPQQAPESDQRGFLMASSNDGIELPTRYHSTESATDLGMYAGRGYDEYGEP